MVERSITAVLKTVDGNIRGFDSLSLCAKAPIFGAFFVSFGKNSRNIDRTIELFCCMLKEEYYRRGFGRFFCG